MGETDSSDSEVERGFGIEIGPEKTLYPEGGRAGIETGQLALGSYFTYLR